jgi:uncharacterized protein
MIRFDVSPLIKARLGASLTLNVDTGPRCLFDLEVVYLRGLLRATRVNGGVFVQGSIESQLDLECVRCLDLFALPVTLDVEETFRLPGVKAKPDLPYAIGDDGWLDLSPLLREQAWVVIPMKPLCSADCQGLCPHCGANLNVETCACEQGHIDPRLALLKTLME